MNRRWTSFQAVEDFFRHEILHALGFGLINPKKRLTSSREFQWTDASGSQQVTAVYMDFQDNAVIAARNHFKCQNLRGVEADDEDRIHLNEYIYGNELMTPILSNGKNYFTKISASILEATRNGKKQWYKTNESLVLAETKAYWYGRKWGCVFAESSCYDYINSQINNGNTTFPFCSATDFSNNNTQYLQTKYVCFANGTRITLALMHCNIIPYIHSWETAFGLRPHTLRQQHFNSLPKSKYQSLYGSDGKHRFCPFLQDVLYDTIDTIPEGVEIVACDQYYKI